MTMKNRIFFVLLLSLLLFLNQEMKRDVTYPTNITGRIMVQSVITDYLIVELFHL